MRTFSVLAIFYQLDILQTSTEDIRCLRRKSKSRKVVTLYNRCTLSRTARQVLTQTRRKNETRKLAEASQPIIGGLYDGRKTKAHAHDRR